MKDGAVTEETLLEIFVGYKTTKHFSDIHTTQLKSFSEKAVY